MAIDNPLKPLDDAFRKLKKPIEELTQPLKTVTEGFVKIGTAIKDVLQPVLTAVLQPLQLLAGGFQSVTSAIGGALGGIGSAIKDKLAPVAGVVESALGGIGGVMGKVATGAGVLSGALSGAGAVIGGFGAAVVGVLKAGSTAAQTFVELGNALGQFVAKANPAAFARFQLAVDDLMAVIGQGLTPVFDTVTKLVRLAGDTFATFSKTVGNAINTALKPVVGFFQLLFDVWGRVGQAVGRVMDRLAPSIAAVGDAINELFRATTPFVNFVIDFLTEGFAQAADIVGDAVKAAIPYVMAFAQVLGDVVSTLMRWTRELLAYVGIDIGEGGPGTKPGSSVGAAAKTATIGSVDSVIKAAQQAAFSLGTGSGSDPAKDTADHTKALVEKSEAIRKAIDSLPERMAVGIGTKLSEAMGFKKGRFESGLERIGLKDSPAAGIGSSLSAAALAAAAAFRSRADTGGSGTVSGAGGSF